MLPTLSWSPGGFEGCEAQTLRPRASQMKPVGTRDTRMGFRNLTLIAECCFVVFFLDILQIRVQANDH